MMKIVFMGSADFGLPCLEKLINEKYDIAGIVTTPPKPKGRGLKIEESPVALFARQHNVEPIFTPIDLNDKDFFNNLSGLHADLFVIVAYRVLPLKIFNLPPLGTINVHASILPKFRGAAPIQRAIEAGEKETGITVFRIDKGVDTGNIISQTKIGIDDQETSPQLYERLSKLGADVLIDACILIDQGKVTYIKQDDACATPAPKLVKNESWINWNLPASVIFNKIRAFKPFPGTYTSINEKRIGIEWAFPLNETAGEESGNVCKVSSEFFDVQCQNSTLRVVEVKPAGKKQMTVEAFLRGTRIVKGMRMG